MHCLGIGPSRNARIAGCGRCLYMGLARPLFDDLLDGTEYGAAFTVKHFQSDLIAKIQVTGFRRAGGQVLASSEFGNAATAAVSISVSQGPSTNDCTSRQIAGLGGMRDQVGVIEDGVFPGLEIANACASYVALIAAREQSAIPQGAGFIRCHYEGAERAGRLALQEAEASANLIRNETP